MSFRRTGAGMAWGEEKSSASDKSHAEDFSFAPPTIPPNALSK